jgi:hypothetical protein
MIRMVKRSVESNLNGNLKTDVKIHTLFLGLITFSDLTVFVQQLLHYQFKIGDIVSIRHGKEMSLTLDTLNLFTFPSILTYKLS